MSNYHRTSGNMSLPRHFGSPLPNGAALGRPSPVAAARKASIGKSIAGVKRAAAGGAAAAASKKAKARRRNSTGANADATYERRVRESVEDGVKILLEALPEALMAQQAGEQPGRQGDKLATIPIQEQKNEKNQKAQKN